MMPSALLEFEQDVISTVVPELTNTRLRRIIKSMPPYTPQTVVDFTLLQARGVFAVRRTLLIRLRVEGFRFRV